MDLKAARFGASACSSAPRVARDLRSPETPTLFRDVPANRIDAANGVASKKRKRS
jgi:hypothetical protein